jgi:branched-chain amino acid transport system substrate-binding protein
MGMHRKCVGMTMALAMMAGLAVTVPTSTAEAASTPGITAHQITLGLDTPLTGPASANFEGALQGAQARIDLQNAEGGVDGRKIKLDVADDQSSPTVAQTAVSSLVQTDNVFGLIFISESVDEAYKLPQQLGVPVVGAAVDGPEWAEQPNTNMVAITGDQGPNLPVYTNIAKALKLAGGTNLAALGIEDVETSAVGVQAFVKSAKEVGLKVGYINTDIPVGSVDTGSVVLAMKSADVNGFASYQLDTTDFSIMEGAKQAGLTLKAPFDYTSYGQDLLNSTSARQAAQGLIVILQQAPVELHTKATEAEQAAFKKYEHFSGVPNLNWTYGWESADLYIYGLQKAGKNPTRAKVLSAIRNSNNWTANGLLPTPRDFSLKDFGSGPSTLCSYFVRLEGSTFDTLNNGKPICGSLVNVGGS